MSDLLFFASLIASGFLGFCLGVEIEIRKIEPLITQCEQNLPRDQHCKLIAAPVKGG